MKREDLMKLLGGFAAGTLTEAERRELFEAALQNQELFEALALEEPLRDALSDPYGRRRVLAALNREPAGWRERIGAWLGRRPAVTPEPEILGDIAFQDAAPSDALVSASRVLGRPHTVAYKAAPLSPSWWRRPIAWTAAGSLAATVVLCVVLVRTNRTAKEAGIRQVAMVRPPAPEESNALTAPPATDKLVAKPAEVKREETPPQVARRASVPAAGELKPAKDRGVVGGVAAPPELAARDHRGFSQDQVAVVEPPPAPAKVAAPVPPTSGNEERLAAAPPPPPHAAAVAAPAPAPPASFAEVAPEVSQRQAGRAAKSVIAKQEANASRRDAAPAMALSRARLDAGGARDLFYSGSARTSLVAGGALGEMKKEKEQAAPMNAPAPARALGLRYTLLRRGLDGRYFELPPDSPIAAGEDARLRIESNEAAYLYVWLNGAPVFSGPVAARRPEMIPAAPGRVVAVLARQAESADTQAVPEHTRAALEGTPPLVDRPAALRPRDQSVYVANPSPAPDARVFADLTLNSR